MNSTSNSSLSCQQKAFILGMILGDGSLKIHAGYKNARLSFRHSIKQKEWFLWKREQLLNWSLSGNKDMWEQQVGTDWSSHKLRYQSKATPELTLLYELIHKGGEKGNIRIWRKWLNQMNELSLAIWWCDDGSLVKNTRQGVFCTDGFTLRDLQVLVKYLNKVWKINTTIHPVGLNRKDGTPRYRLWMRSCKDLQNFLLLIAPFIPVYSMLYKVVLLYRDSQLQQRWISELVQRTRFTQSEIEQVVLERKRSLKAFQAQRKNEQTENDIVQPLKENLNEKVIS